MNLGLYALFFFFKQKTAYEISTRDWSSDVCSSDLVGLSIATFGFYGSKGPFWSMPPMFMTGTAAGAPLARINPLGNLGGFCGPWYVGVIKDWTDSYAGGLYGLAFLCVMSAVVCALFLHIPNPTVRRGQAPSLAAD